MGPRIAALAAALTTGLLLVLAAAPAKADTDSADGEQLTPPHDSGLLVSLDVMGLLFCSYLHVINTQVCCSCGPGESLHLLEQPVAVVWLVGRRR